MCDVRYQAIDQSPLARHCPDPAGMAIPAGGRLIYGRRPQIERPQITDEFVVRRRFSFVFLLFFFVFVFFGLVGFVGWFLFILGGGFVF